MEKYTTINGNTYRVGFDLATLLSIESRFEIDFTEVLEKIQPSEGAPKRKDIALYLYACLYAHNPEIPTYEDWLHDINHMDDLAQLFILVSQAAGDFFTHSRMDGNAKKKGESEGNV